MKIFTLTSWMKLIHYSLPSFGNRFIYNYIIIKITPRLLNHLVNIFRTSGSFIQTEQKNWKKHCYILKILNYLPKKRFTRDSFVNPELQNAQWTKLQQFRLSPYFVTEIQHNNTQLPVSFVQKSINICLDISGYLRCV